MQGSPFRYQFSVDVRGSFLPHETLPLQILELINRGARQSGASPIRLRRAALRAGWTLHDLAADPARFAAANVNIEDQQLALNFGKYWSMNVQQSLDIHIKLIIFL
jgi:hypothetical protein